MPGELNRCRPAPDDREARLVRRDLPPSRIPLRFAECVRKESKTGNETEFMALWNAIVRRFTITSHVNMPFHSTVLNRSDLRIQSSAISAGPNELSTRELPGAVKSCFSFPSNDLAAALAAGSRAVSTRAGTRCARRFPPAKVLRSALRNASSVVFRFVPDSSHSFVLSGSAPLSLVCLLSVKVVSTARRSRRWSSPARSERSGRPRQVFEQPEI